MRRRNGAGGCLWWRLIAVSLRQQDNGITSLIGSSCDRANRVSAPRRRFKRGRSDEEGDKSSSGRSRRGEEWDWRKPPAALVEGGETAAAAAGDWDWRSRRLAGATNELPGVGEHSESVSRKKLAISWRSRGVLGVCGADHTAGNMTHRSAGGRQRRKRALLHGRTAVDDDAHGPGRRR